ncbi:MAG: endolytic transglycosylase MltG [Bacteroidales bacterium]|nr:endolytic transglycosylase MltG [Bacteroidales bacterium]
MKKKTIVTLVLLVVLVLLVILGARTILGSRTANNEPTRIYITNHTSYNTLCDDIGANVYFRLMTRALGLYGKQVRPGSYVIEPHMRNLTLVRKLRNGQQDPIRLTIGKFRTPEQLNEYLNDKLMHDDFKVTLDSFYIIRPNTYEFYWTVTPENFMERMEKEYQRFWGKKDLKDLKDLKDSKDLKDPKDLTILASIVEEETNNNAEKPLIASVYINRLKKGMPLQADPTVKYAVGDFTLRRILNKHLDAESPFNTYLHTGLPPEPICLPSDASVDAVINAPLTNYIYFCASDKMDGTHRFATTLAEHNRNAAAFHHALNKKGIK